MREHRGQIIAAVLTIVRAWFVAGKPAGPGPVFGSFESWSKMLAGILQFAGVEGFLENLPAMYDEMDQDTPVWSGFTEAWYTTQGKDPVTAHPPPGGSEPDYSVG